MTRHRDLQDEGVVATVRTPDGYGHAARVVRTQLTGNSFHVDLAFAGSLPTFEDGEEVIIAFSGNRIAGRPTTRSTYLEGTQGLPRGIGRFHVDLCTRGGLSGLTERRSSKRVPTPAAPIVELRLIDSELDAAWHGNMLDLSSGGLQLEFQASGDPAFPPGQRVEVRFEVANSSEQFRFEAEIQYRRLGGGRASYGMGFERVTNDEYDAREGRLIAVLIGLACEAAA